ncbi:MAG: hypothetical protein COA67_09745 [Lutibacter sp.]|nr:MAG: hypothetical protein COA67_09745 [Lutibacter sp.]
MKQVFHKISSFLMAITVLFSTFSFTVDKHYCGDTLVDTSVFGKAQNCGMEMEQSTFNSDCSVAKKDCCTEKQEVIQGQDELKISFDTLSFEQQTFIVSYLYSYVSLFEVLGDNTTSYRDYAVPFVVKELYKLDETYLI